MTFRSLPLGAKFRFEGEVRFRSGMAYGPWIKTGTRTYTHAETGGKYRVGSINAKVLNSNPGAKKVKHKCQCTDPKCPVHKGVSQCPKAARLL